MKLRCVFVGLATSECFCRESRINQDNAFDPQMFYYLLRQ